MNLSDYYAPLNFFNLSIFLFFFVAMDICGNIIAVLLKFPGFLRYINWIFGLGFFVFFWFLLHLFLPFRTDYIVISIILFTLPFLPFYFKNKGLLSLLKEIRKFPYPLIFLLPIAQKLFFLLSMPPYVTDEIAYHYSSPAEIIIRQSWDFGNNINLYYMLPRTLETAYSLMFTLTHTYAIARLLHFVIFISSVSAISIFLKEKINIFVAIVYSLFAIFLFAIPLVDSTRGYIDVAPAILSSLLLITMVGWLIDKKRGYIYAAASLMGLMIGIKYTVLGFTIAIIVLMIIFVIIGYRSKIKNYLDIRIIKENIKSNLSIVIIVPLLVVSMGGYWYIKNFIVTANPIYPFAFKCKNNISCGDKNEFFGTWGVQFRIENWSKFLQVAQETLK